MGHWYDFFTHPGAPHPRPGDQGLPPGSYYTGSPLSPGDAYNGAQYGARDISGQFDQFSQDQWRRQMEGLAGAEGAYGPSQAYWQSAYGSQGPGAMENWWQQHQGGFDREPLQNQAYNNYNNWLSQGNNAQQGANAANQYLSGPTASSQAWGSMGQGLQSYNGPTSGQEAYRFNQGAYQAPGAGEQRYAANQNQYNPANSAANNVYQNFSSQLYGPSRSEEYHYVPAMEEKEAKDRLYNQLDWSNQQTAGQRNEGENKGYVRGANDLNQYYQSQLGALSGPGQYEQFITADINGTNPAYERQRQRGIASINQEMARRGAFNSGSAIDRIGNYTAELDAQDYDRRRQSAQAAQQMQMARIGQGLQGAGAVSSQKLAQGQALQGMDVQNEAGELSRHQFGEQALNDYKTQSRADKQLGLQANAQADAAKLSRLQGLQGMGSAADQGVLGYLGAGQNAANDAENLALQRYMGQQNAANSVDQTRIAADNQALQRMLASYQMAQGSDQANLARAQQMFAQGMGLDQNMMAKYAQQANMGQGIDQQMLAQLLGGGQMAGNAQSAEQQRLAQAFGALFGMNNAQAGQYGQFYGQGGQLSGQAYEDAMNALMAAYGYQAQGNSANAAMPWQLASLGAQYYGARR